MVIFARQIMIEKNINVGISAAYVVEPMEMSRIHVDIGGERSETIEYAFTHEGDVLISADGVTTMVCNLKPRSDEFSKMKAKFNDLRPGNRRLRRGKPLDDFTYIFLNSAVATMAGCRYILSHGDAGKLNPRYYFDLNLATNFREANAQVEAHRRLMADVLVAIERTVLLKRSIDHPECCFRC